MMQKTNVKQDDRLEFIDSLRGFAIFCVLWGHSIQYLRDKSYFFHNDVFEFIYSFHMPLFFLISGFFFKSSLKLSFNHFLYKKGTQLLLPCFVWGVLFTSYNTINSFILDKSSIHWMQVFKAIFSPFAWPFWFLRELFISFCIVYVLCKICKKDYLVFVLGICFISFAPYCTYQRFLLPMFLAGYSLRNVYQSLSNHINKALFFSGATFCVCLLFWKGDYTIYLSGFPRLLDFRNTYFYSTHLYIDCIREAIGLAGSIFFLVLFQKLYMYIDFFKYLKYIGKYTLEIYIVQTTILEMIINKAIDFSNTNFWVYNLIITPFIALMVIALCIVITFFIKKYRYANFLLFGNSIK